MSLVLTDLTPLPVEAPAAPRLPTLERLIARADTTEGPADWRRFALASFGIGAGNDAPAIASTVALASGVDPTGGWYLATALHLVAGLDHVRVHPAGPLALDAVEAQGLAASHAQAFAGSGTELVATPFGLLWRADGLGPVECADPEPWTGRDLGPALPRGADSGRLTRAMTELQMWLHARPADSRGRLGPNALWLWGASAAPAVRPARSPALRTADPYLMALASLADAAATDVGETLWTVSLSALGREGDAFALAEARVFAPLAARLAAGRWRRCELWFAGRIHRLRGAQRFRVWREVRPWWAAPS